MDEQRRDVSASVLRKDGFIRFHAKRQASFDTKMTMLGTVMYFSMIRSSFQISAPLSAVNIALGLHCLWPFFLYSKAPDVYLTWREPLFLLHFFIHHAFAPLLLIGSGVHVRGSVIAADNPAIFLSKFLVSSSLLWQILNSLMYRVRLGKFLVWQPFILAATFPTEIDTCRYVAAARPDLTATVFGALQEWGRVVLAGSMGLGRPFSSENTHAIDPYTSCFHVHAFLIVMGGYVVPSLVIWTLDKHAWHSFLAQDPRSLRWKEGPNERELQEGMAELRRENKAGEGTSEPDWRSAIVLFIAAACVWQALDMMIH